MGSYSGGTPGRLLEVLPPFPTDLASGLKPSFAEYGAGGPGEDTMNPHGLDVNADSTIAITGDFIEPGTLFASSPDQIKFRDTIRIWRRNVNGNAGWTNTKTFTVPGAGGVQDVQVRFFGHARVFSTANIVLFNWNTSPFLSGRLGFLFI